MSILKKIFKRSNNFEEGVNSFQSENSQSEGHRPFDKLDEADHLRKKRKPRGKKMTDAQKRDKAKKLKAKLTKKSNRRAKRKKLGGKIKMFAKYAVLSPLFAPLLPLKPAMVVILKKRGVKVKMLEPIALVVEKFTKNVTVNQGHLEENLSRDRHHQMKRQAIETFELSNFTGYETFEQSPENFAGAVVAGATTAIKLIVGFFKKLKAKKQAGEKLNDDEKAGLDVAEKTAEKVEGKSTEEVAKELKEPQSTAEVKQAVEKSETASVNKDEDGKGIKSKADESEDGTGKKKTLLIGGGIAVLVLLFLLMKKK